MSESEKKNSEQSFREVARGYEKQNVDIATCLLYQRAQVSKAIDINPATSPKCLNLYHNYRIQKGMQFANAAALNEIAKHIRQEIIAQRDLAKKAIEKEEDPKPFLVEAMSLKEKLDEVVREMEEL